VLPDGGFLIADGDYVVRRVSPTGIITTVAGTGVVRGDHKLGTRIDLQPGTLTLINGDCSAGKPRLCRIPLVQVACAPVLSMEVDSSRRAVIPPRRRPFVIAHRSGNSLAALRAAEADGVRTVEADVHLFRGRLEVRHLKTLGPVPILWDRWKLGNPFRRRLLVAELLSAAGAGTELVLDLKGGDRRIGELVRESLRPYLERGMSVTICARSWPLLEPFRGHAGVRCVHSIGSARQLARLRRLTCGARVDGVSIHERLLDASTVHELRDLAEVVMTWPVNTLERGRELLMCGVDGLISDRPSLLLPALVEPEAA
jgi:glycerophosphoryl diester phosphodiesterase